MIHFLRFLRDVCIIWLLAILCWVGVEVHSAVKDFREVEAQAKVTLATANKSVADTSSMVNANLIHLDLILGRAERVSRTQEAYWDMMSKKSAVTLDRTNALLGELENTSKAVRGDADEITIATVNSLNEIPPVLKSTTKTIQDTDALVSAPEIRSVLTNVDKTTKEMATTSANVAATTGDIRDKVHQITHPKLATKIATWTLRVVHAIGSFF